MAHQATIGSDRAILAERRSQQKKRRIRPQLTPDSKLGEKLPSLGTNELIPEEPANEDYGQGDRADIQHRREQERDVRGAAKTIAQLALEMSHVHRLADG